MSNFYKASQAFLSHHQFGVILLLPPFFQSASFSWRPMREKEERHWRQVNDRAENGVYVLEEPKPKPWQNSKQNLKKPSLSFTTSPAMVNLSILICSRFLSLLPEDFSSEVNWICFFISSQFAAAKKARSALFFICQFSIETIFRSDLLLRCDQTTRCTPRRRPFQTLFVVFEAVINFNFSFRFLIVSLEETVAEIEYISHQSNKNYKFKIDRGLTFFRRYRNGFVWQDLSDDDLINPSQGQEYILKGTALLLEASSSFRSCETSSSFSESKFSSETNTSSTDSNFPVALKRNNQPWNSLEDLCRSVVYKAKISGESGTNASTQTGERRRRWTDGGAGEECGGEGFSNSGVGRSDSFRSMDCDGAADLRNQTTGKSNRWKASTVLMQLITCNTQNWRFFDSYIFSILRS